jgi:hypothetical protein
MTRVAISIACLLMTAGLLCAADISGTWTASFETQIGVQNYTYEFKVDGEKLTGTAKSNLGSATIAEGSVKGDVVTFVENLDFQGQPVRITYKGKVNGNEIQFTREVGEFATEQLVAKRSK